MEERALLSRAAYLPLAPGGAGPFHPCGGNLDLLLTLVSSLYAHSQPHLGTAPWSAKATELWSLFSGATQQLPGTQLIIQLDTMPSEKIAVCMGEPVSSLPLPAGPFWASVCFTTGADRQC